MGDPAEGDDLGATLGLRRRRRLAFGRRGVSPGALLGWMGVVLLLVVLVGNGVGAWWLLRSGESRSAEQTVDDFFQAQRDGDCELLIDLVTERSWSNGGEWSRGEFLDLCADAVEDYEPVDELHVSIYDQHGNQLSDLGDDPDQDGARALVELPGGSEAWSIYERGLRAPAGSLVREDREWKVETDEVVLRIGRSVHDTMRGYLEAYNDGDCARMLGYLSERAWSADGRLDRDEFLGRCADAAEAREARQQPPIDLAGPPGLDVRFEGQSADEVVRQPEEVMEVFGVYERAIAAVQYELGGPHIGGGIFQSSRPEEALFVKEGLSWRLDGSEELSDDIGPGAPLAGVRYVELQALLPDEVQRDGQRCVSFVDSTIRVTDIDNRFEIGLRRAWSRCPDDETRVTLYLHADEEQAHRAAEYLAGGRSGEPEALAHQVPEVQGVPEDAFGIGSSAVVAHENIVVSVDSAIGSGDLGDAAQILTALVEQM